MKVRLIVLILCFAALPMSAKSDRSRVANDVSRLSAILIDSQNEKATISADAWRVTANEANSLATRIVANSGGRKAARELQTHVREMRSAALKGDADGARSHAGAALPFAYEVTDWASK